MWDVAVAVGATAAVMSERVRGAIRSGAVYGLAGAFMAADAVSGAGRGGLRSAQQALSSARGVVQEATESARNVAQSSAERVQATGEEASEAAGEVAEDATEEMKAGSKS